MINRIRSAGTTVARVTAVVAMVGAGVLAATGPAQAALTTSCVGTAADVTVPGDLVVPAGKSCDLTNVVVQGKTTVRKNANLITAGSTFNGRVTVQQNGYLDLTATTVSGATKFNSAYGGYFEGSTLSGNVRSTDSGFLYSIGSHHAGQFASTNGATYIESGRLSKSLTTEGDALTDLTDTVINGKVAIANADNGSVVCSSEIDGAAAFTGAGADATVQIGAAGPIADCGFNVFASSLTLNGNHGPVSVGGNVIRGDLSCADNDVTPTGSDNRVRGASLGQCADLSPAAEAAAPKAAPKAMSRAATPKAATSKAGNPEVRQSDILAKIAQRSTAGSHAASAAGLAAIGR